MPVWTWISRGAGANAQHLLRKGIDDARRLGKKYPVVLEYERLNVLLADDPVVRESTPGLFSTHGFGIAKASLVSTQGAMLNPRTWHRPVQAAMKRYLTREGSSAVVGAYALIRVEDAQKTREDFHVVQQGREKFFRRDVWFRRRVYNICRSGYLSDILYESVLDLEEENLPAAEISKKIQQAFDQTVEMNHLSVFLSDEVDDGNFVQQITQRKIIEQCPLVRVFGRGRNWKRAKKLAAEFAKVNGFNFHVEDTPIGGQPAGCCRIWNKDHGLNWPTLERMLEEQVRQQIETGRLH